MNIKMNNFVLYFHKKIAIVLLPLNSSVLLSCTATVLLPLIYFVSLLSHKTYFMAKFQMASQVNLE